MISLFFVLAQLMISSVPAKASFNDSFRSILAARSHNDARNSSGRAFVMDRKYFCGAYVQYDVVLVEQLLNANYNEGEIPFMVSDMVKNLFNVANSVFSKTESKYLKYIVFYARYLRRKPVREIAVDEFVRRNHVDNSEHFCFLVHITATHSRRRRDFLGFGNVGSVCNAHRTGPTSRALHGMSMAINVAKLRTAAYIHELTFIHELGHVLGAEHDGLAELIVGGTLCPVWNVDPENNIMFYKSRDRFNVQQRSFSECSIRQMEQTLESIFESGVHKTCFDSFGADICGNGIVEAGEQCDCGFSKEFCAEDQCCHPATVSSWNKTDKPCTYTKRTPETQCSVSNGPCCDGTSCRFRARGTLCEAESPCRYASHCSGDSAQCPVQLEKPDKIRCAEAATCLNGTCKGSLCLHYNLTSCTPWRTRGDELCKTFCSSPETKSCVLLCKLHSTESCDRLLAPGFECAGGEGTCDFRGFCFRLHRQKSWVKALTVISIMFSVVAYFLTIMKMLPKVPHGNFARSRAAKKLQKKVLDYVKRLQELEIDERRHRK